MHATSYQDSTGTLSVLERYDGEECKSSEATWLPVAWRSLQPWQSPLRPKARARAASAPSNNKHEATVGVLDDYLVSVRVEKAKDLLLNPNYYFSEIAVELAFESLGQFNEAFKRFVGESPHAYRARLPVRNVCQAEMD